MQTTSNLLTEFEIGIIEILLNSIKKDEMTKEDVIRLLETRLKELNNR